MRSSSCGESRVYNNDYYNNCNRNYDHNSRLNNNDHSRNHYHYSKDYDSDHNNYSEKRFTQDR